jgi:two-component system NtrC family sensor kinase
MSGSPETSSNLRRPRSRWSRLRDPSVALLAAAVLLPVLLFALAAWESYRETLREAEARVERTARILEEHALKVFETHRLVIQQVNLRMRFVDWTRAEDRQDLYHLLKQFQDDLDQIATVTVTDAEGRLRASGRTYPADPNIRFDDRDYFQELKKSDAALPYVSRAYAGRQSGIAIFNLAARVHAASPAFDGVIAVSVDRGYFERFYQSVEPTIDHSVDLVREDGQILARVPPSPLRELLPHSVFLSRLRQAPVGSFTAVSRIDGVERIFAYRKIEDYPVYVRFGVSRQAALAPWRRSLLAYGIVAALASLSLIGVSVLALRQTDRERHARRRWQETAAALQTAGAERAKVEDQLRQAQKMEAVGRLTGGVAHDFNNLLTAVIGSLDLARRRASTMDSRTLDLIGNAMEGATRAAALTSRLLAFSRQQPLQPASLDANSLVAGMSDLMRRTLGETIDVKTILAEDVWTVMVDPNQLESAVLNLAVNARDAMPEGGTLTIETANVHVDREVVPGRPADLAPGDYVVMTVSDGGSGMSPDVLMNIFEPFFTTKPVGKGTGLGLSQVYGFVKQSGGNIGVESSMGRGSAFRLYLPRAQQQTVAAPAPSAHAQALEPPSENRGETIVVVEDEPMVRRLSVAALEEAGYRVLAAPDGAGGLELLRREPNVALLFTDVVLGGGMNGRALADAIHRERPDLPVLFTTGYTRDAIVQHGRVDEGITLIGKPFTGASLVAKVGTLLRNRSGAAVATL